MYGCPQICAQPHPPLTSKLTPALLFRKISARSSKAYGAMFTTSRTAWVSQFKTSTAWESTYQGFSRLIPVSFIYDIAIYFETLLNPGHRPPTHFPLLATGVPLTTRNGNYTHGSPDTDCEAHYHPPSIAFSHSILWIELCALSRMPSEQQSCEPDRLKRFQVYSGVCR